MRLIGLAVALTLSLVPAAFPSAAQEYYRWLDKCGNVHYTQTPPAQDQEPCVAAPLLSLDSQDPRYSAYLGQVRAKIKAHWEYPCVRNEALRRCAHKATKLVVEFGLFQDGRLVYATVRKNAEWLVYDEYAVNAIQQASPFPPVPIELVAPVQPGSASLRILAAFEYVIHDPSNPWHERK